MKCLFKYWQRRKKIYFFSPKHKDIILKLANKGGTFVVIDYIEYHRGMLNLLKDELTYVRLLSDPMSTIKNKIYTVFQIDIHNHWKTKESILI